MVNNILVYLFCLTTFVKFSHAANDSGIGVMERIKLNELNWIEKALSGEIDIDQFNVDGDTPLTLAVTHNQQEKALQLISKGANVNIAGRHNETALLRASGRGDLLLVKKLLSVGADPNIAHDGLAIAPQVDKQTGLFYAAIKGHRDIVLALIEAGVDLSLEKHDRNILVSLARFENEEMIKLLFSKGVKNNILKDKIELFTTNIQMILKSGS